MLGPGAYRYLLDAHPAPARRPAKRAGRKWNMRNILTGAFAALAMLVPASAAVARSCDAAAGERIFARCKDCHRLQREANGPRTGPYLSGVVGRPVAGAEDFRYYSDAMEAYAAGGISWDLGRLSAFLENPQEEVPGTKMAFLGLPSPQDRESLICYLETVK
jgi:cytochrome c